MRIQLQFPEKSCFSTTLRIRVSDLNYANHLSNDKLLTYAHQARVELFAQWGCTELQFDGVGIIMTDAAIVFKAEGHLHDELRIEVAVADVSRLGFDLYYKLINTQTQQEVAIIKTGIVCFNYETRKVASLPERIRELLG